MHLNEEDSLEEVEGVVDVLEEIEVREVLDACGFVGFFVVREHVREHFFREEDVRGVEYFLKRFESEQEALSFRVDAEELIEEIDA